jgi:hypothetical protein
MTLAGLFAPKGINWILEFIFLFLFFLVVGSLVSKRLSGILIDERNQMSLSRFQIVVWTLIILSAYLTIALARITAGVADPLAIGIDWQLWALLGISSASLVGSPLLLSEKKDRKSSPAEETRFDEITKEKNENLQLFGKIPVRDSPNDALFTDMFRGDEAATFYNINMAKVQMFFFTIIAALSYGFAILTLVINTDSSMINNLPPVSPGLVAILGISHAAYLTNKGIDQTG